MKRITKTMMAVAAAAFALAIAVPAAQAQDAKTYTLKFNHVLGAKEPYHLAFLAWAKAVGERTGGKMKVEVFHSAQLGVEEDIIEQMRQGANVGQNSDSARLGNYVPEIAMINGPYFVETLDEAIKLRKSPTINKYLDDLANKFGIKVISFSYVQGYRHFFTNKPIKSPEDLKGMRIRTPPAPIWQESVRALGATPVAMAFGEMYPALQQKAIDGVELVYNNIPAGRFNEVLKYANETHHIMLVNFSIMSSKFFNSLPADYQKILLEEADKAGEAVSKQIAASEAEIAKQLAAKGMTIVKDANIEAFKKAGDKAYEVLKIQAAKDAVLKEIGKK